MALLSSTEMYLVGKKWKRWLLGGNGSQSNRPATLSRTERKNPKKNSATSHPGSRPPAGDWSKRESDNFRFFLHLQLGKPNRQQQQKSRWWSRLKNLICGRVFSDWSRRDSMKPGKNFWNSVKDQEIKKTIEIAVMADLVQLKLLTISISEFCTDGVKKSR